MPYVKIDVYTMRDLSRATGMDYLLLYKLIVARGIFPEPEHKIGRRYYYTPETFEDVKEQVEKYMKEGGAK
jgi:hypothetical protein